jgi:uncharacterized membrane protein YkgB
VKSIVTFLLLLFIGFLAPTKLLAGTTQHRFGIEKDVLSLQVQLSSVSFEINAPTPWIQQEIQPLRRRRVLRSTWQLPVLSENVLPDFLVCAQYHRRRVQLSNNKYISGAGVPVYRLTPF